MVSAQAASANRQEADDFVDYIDSIQWAERLKAREARDAEMREEWRRTTWAGALIATVERFGLSRFFEAVGKSFEGGADASTTYYITSLFARITSIAVAILVVYGIGRVIRMVVGDEIVVEQEIVIVEEITKAEAEAEALAALAVDSNGEFEASGGDAGASDDCQEEEVPVKDSGPKLKNRRGKHSRS